jgi:NAD(P)-dependent dehydrogenase (short-subunit alcohol dehydrogenase family)
MTRSLTGKVAPVTGAAKGIGAGIAKASAAAGASVVVNFASDRLGAERVVAEIKAAGGNAFAAQADVSIVAEVEHLCAEAVATFGPLDILVNNASVFAFAWTTSALLAERPTRKTMQASFAARPSVVALSSRSTNSSPIPGRAVIVARNP